MRVSGIVQLFMIIEAKVIHMFSEESYTSQRKRSQISGGAEKSVVSDNTLILSGDNKKSSAAICYPGTTQGRERGCN